METLGIEHVPAEKRHGKAFSQFTLWLGANLTIADFALGAYLFGLPLGYVVLAVLVGNILAGAMLGLMASMGPTFGYPQMMISRAVFGRNGNLPFAVANWVSTVGWFTVNTILGGLALNLAFGVSFTVGALVLVVVQALLAIYGHDIIHGFEIVMSVVLASMFAIVTAVAYWSYPSHAAALAPYSSFNAYTFAFIVALVFSYLMSWSPYASDYSRYLRDGTGRLKVALLVMAGGIVASLWVELVGFGIFVDTCNPFGAGCNANMIQGLSTVAAGYSAFALLAIVIGAVAANALNIYTNSLSALVVYGRSKRRNAVILAAVAGFLLALVGGANFQGFYQDFLITLDYWITPWIGVMLAAFFLRGVRSGVERPGVAWRALGAYVVGLVASVPFMNLTSYGIPYEGPVASLLQGADVSYFASFAVAVVAYLLLVRAQVGPGVRPTGVLTP